MMDEIGNDYDHMSEKKIITNKQPKTKTKVKKLKGDPESQGYNSNDSGIRMGGNIKREKFKTICQKE